MNLYQCFDIDEVTPIQFVGVYVTRWRPAWGEPTVMFREVEDNEALAFAAQLDAVRALVEDLRTAELTCRVQSDLHKRRQNSRDAMEWDAMADRFRAHLAPFEVLSDV